MCLDDDAEDGDTFLYTGDQHHFGDGLSESYQDEELDGSITSSVSVQRSTAGGPCMNRYNIFTSDGPVSDLIAKRT